jgi:hypothetical protein
MKLITAVFRLFESMDVGSAFGPIYLSTMTEAAGWLPEELWRKSLPAPDMEPDFSK